ncbi:hypothetical protein RO3G_05412 [Rhizopus delemar RA 99-880]|uniref:Uncharacterized protein n=1 Tax=Rhizopus delemar (strain RA 99-880 / ATCC MYA-4621 / FGSC 9543 / NRRL 43880) TaxID=246409 RepID=I1BWX7_RHIO9|nr:hypothetical protein RO3G_05412 [Rhizopus delemar RA 99-880]|eukprot:EIE80707.1 hypothetical protein RO3G_05412 [Rhizopus delemar RA 99-880]
MSKHDIYAHNYSFTRQLNITHATQKPYERPVTRSQSIPPKESIYVLPGSVQVGQTDNMDTECSVDPSSSVTPTDEEPNNHMIQYYE